jgi:hypothetical protein
MRDENFLALVRVMIRGFKFFVRLLEELVHERSGANARTDKG